MLLGLLSLTGFQPAVGEEREPEVITPDYDNGVFEKAGTPLPGLVIERVEDLRGRDPKNLGFTATGLLERSTPLELSEPVSDFVKRGLEKMLASDEKVPEPTRVVIGIEQFDVNFKKSIIQEITSEFYARLEIRILHDGSETVVGWLENSQEAPGGFSTKGGQETMMYKGVGAFAQGLGFGTFPLTEAAAKIRSGASAGLERPTVRVAFIEPWTIGSAEFAGGRLVYHNFALSDMPDTYDDCFLFVAEAVIWLKGRQGWRIEGGYVQRKGRSRLGNSAWNVTESELSLNAIPLHASFLYRLRTTEEQHLLVPYVGIGAGTFLGIENLAATATDTGNEGGFEAHSRALRASGDIHVLLGTQMRFGMGVEGILEARWTQSTNGSTVDLIKEEEQEDYDSTLFKAVRRSDFNFTGWSVELGLRFRVSPRGARR